MTATDPRTVLDALIAEYTARANAIREDLARSHSPDFAEQALQRENDEVLEAILAETEAALRRVGMAKLRLVDGSYGYCQRCGEPIEPARLAVLPAAEFCLGCADMSG
ncbi:TraR/DksA family transcriptional regulator [Pseudomonas boanensis]|uniref:TraR/DksA family transcriptional regulator n=1 Tax=Metapseudomonas boanensis TaxID=2822138 RepID=A0ABS5XN15_9GAMM|nr:TraR/DksA family transcriptional regulator [Pseudomonas boanensis]MBT8769020.1 TraR/DksA family transcriptional regulator [Pseudomonas boanensis]